MMKRTMSCNFRRLKNFFKPVLYVLAMLMAFSSCSKDDDPEIFEEVFDEWGIVIPYQDVSKSQTYHLLEELVDHIDNKMQVPTVTSRAANFNFFSVTVFNAYLRVNKEATAFFSREDCVSVLISTYLNELKIERRSEYHLQINFDILELLLASDVFISKMNKSEKCQLMALALARAKYENYSFSYSFNIMISIMLSMQYTPFVENVKPMLRESTMGVSF